MLYRRDLCLVGVTAAYLGAVEFWAYGVYGAGRNDVAPGDFWNSWRPFAILALVHLCAGFLLGRYRGLLLPVAAVLLAIPAGTAPDGYPELPIWGVVALQAAFGGVPLLLAGLLARKLVSRRARPGSRRARGSGPRAVSRTRAARR